MNNMNGTTNTIHNISNRTHTVDYRIKLTNSKLFDTMMYAGAVKLCGKFPGLQFRCEDHALHIFGELSDNWFQKYQEELFYSMLPA
ncbi:MAG: hypothetical protein IJU29_06560 [Oscillospiraceae bacterium]|nr:hypothetical protein [Oscillospiraceae bacterium]